MVSDVRNKPDCKGIAGSALRYLSRMRSLLPESNCVCGKKAACARGAGGPQHRMVTKVFARRASSTEQSMRIPYPRRGSAIIVWRPMLAPLRAVGGRVVLVKYIYALFAWASGVSLCVMCVGGVRGRVLASLVVVRLHPRMFDIFAIVVVATANASLQTSNRRCRHPASIAERRRVSRRSDVNIWKIAIAGSTCVSDACGNMANPCVQLVIVGAGPGA